MKAIILEIRDGYAAALREDGLIVKTRQLAAVGETVELSEKVVPFPTQGRRAARAAVAAVLALAVTGGAYTYTNVAAASYVTLDTETASVELAVNRVGRVVAVRALDENSEELASELAADVRRKSVTDAVDAAMARLDGAPTVVAGVTGENDKRAAELQEAVERGASRGEHNETELVTLAISRDEHRAAAEHSTSAGRAAFERGGGDWHGKKSADAAEPSADTTEPSTDTTTEPSAETAESERPAFAPTERPAAPPADAPTPPDSGQTPPDSGQTPPDGGQTPPDGGQMPPDGGQTPPDGGQTPPDNGQTPPDGQSPLTDGQTLPTNGQTPPDGGQAPTDAQTPPADAPTPPDGGRTPPTGGSSDMAQGGQPPQDAAPRGGMGQPPMGGMGGMNIPMGEKNR